eukprot:TRINITY_DN528_c0_g1_i2.p1 TRINITY_DN528_c0_g1~~TRINITY_DN528_c0_g1_i2.p1  ORF type:complete len:279 (+),score=83.20 TRINITY_DN528_c0_g1_i2:63-899(+)
MGGIFSCLDDDTQNYNKPLLAEQNNNDQFTAPSNDQEYIPPAPTPKQNPPPNPRQTPYRRDTPTTLNNIPPVPSREREPQPEPEVALDESFGKKDSFEPVKLDEETYLKVTGIQDSKQSREDQIHGVLGAGIGITEEELISAPPAPSDLPPLPEDIFSNEPRLETFRKLRENRPALPPRTRNPAKALVRRRNNLIENNVIEDSSTTFVEPTVDLDSEEELRPAPKKFVPPAGGFGMVLGQMGSVKLRKTISEPDNDDKGSSSSPEQFDFRSVLKKRDP